MCRIKTTMICLIPKSFVAVRVTNYRLISLCNVVYKIVAKTMANRLRSVIGEVVSDNQSAFVPRRLILENSIIGFECMHALQSKKGKSGSSVCGSISSTRGLCQGDPLPAIRRIPDVYFKALGQLVNYEKSGMCVSRSVPQAEGAHLASLIGVCHVRCHERYLGLPSFARRNKRQLFKNIKDLVWDKIKGWRSSLLSVGGKEVLLKAILQAIPTYSMSLFQLSKSLIREIQRLCYRFWWGTSDFVRHIHWAFWMKLSKSKDDGGMGFRDLIAFNQALLAIQG
ncbi:hypothetical protein Dsin_027977 [Dipteronia sinensis]|uniref:Reverse transcriptase n=1 Tax=Dipteronia sinensis TaxID=43782 RepID=A0AAD9ZR59_9ROSI|nr:hypothetical protein Dsin_027977 [Dipteronia sinensis]